MVLGLSAATAKVPGSGICCSPCHEMPSDTRAEGHKLMQMTWRAMGLENIARHIIGCQSPQRGFKMRVDDVAGNVCQAPPGPTR